MRKKIKVMLMLAAAACMILGNTLSVSAAPADKFTDVSPEASYYAAVNWAVEQGVISGTSQTTFSPNKPCTRYQYAVMLYKLAGKPAVEGENPFTDVTETASYYKAVTWAYNQGIISGTTKTTFSPDASVTRYQVVAMLYKMIGRPAVDSAENPFADVSSEASYYKAVMWAVQNKITSGTSATTFSPDAECLRYQMMVFLKKFWPIYTASTNKIVVLDPGHSAVFAGAGYAGYEEHIVNLKVALACKE
ncbi:MAG: S-layer homology domain-containing protein, partial [Lachnospiraceae bacterium]|nr:S-layer homology domain-containing protein [Lachnospiraceae bacterium]